MRREQMLEGVTGHLGIGHEPASKAIGAVLWVLGEMLPRMHWDAIARAWGIEVGGLLGPPQEDQVELDAPGFVRAVARLAALPEGIAREEAQVVCQMLARWSDGATLDRLHAALSQSVAEMFTVPPHQTAVSAQEHRVAGTGPSSSLARGQPGSGHPLSQGHGPAHTGSLAAEGADRIRTKLATATQAPSEWERRTLASGRSTPRHPLNESN